MFKIEMGEGDLPFVITGPAEGRGRQGSKSFRVKYAAGQEASQEDMFNGERSELGGAHGAGPWCWAMRKQWRVCSGQWAGKEWLSQWRQDIGLLRL